MGFETLDWIMLGSYFAVILGITGWVVIKGKDTADDYFLAGRNLAWWVIGASIFASNIGSFACSWLHAPFRRPGNP